MKKNKNKKGQKKKQMNFRKFVCGFFAAVRMIGILLYNQHAYIAVDFFSLSLDFLSYLFASFRKNTIALFTRGFLSIPKIQSHFQLPYSITHSQYTFSSANEKEKLAF